MTAEQANQIIFEKKLIEADIAYDIGISPQALNYQLHKAKNFDAEVSERIAHFFDKKGICRSELSLNDRLKFRMMIDELRSEFNKRLDELDEFVDK